MTTIRRRDFLKTALVAGGSAAALGGSMGVLTQLARAAGDGSDRFYVFAYFSGGWDVLLSLDPRDPTRFNADNARETRILPGYDLIDGITEPLVRASDNLTFGPFIGNLARHADKLAVIRGMSMETLTHEVGRRRFLTGKPPSGLQARGSSGATWLAAKLGGEDAIPNLSVRVESYNADLPTYASALRVGTPDDMVDVLARAEPVLDEPREAALASFLEAEADCGRARHSALLRTAEAARGRLRTLLDRDIQALFDFRASTPEMEALRDRYQMGTDYGGAEAQAALAAQAIIHGVSRCVSIQAAGGLDTHFQEWETEQGPTQQRGFDAIARLMDHLAESEYLDTGESMLDHTTIVGFSEFMRTPLINDRGGRDHWLTNSCFLAGGNIEGDTVVGASSDVGMSPQPVDLATGRVDPAGEVVRPEHVLRTLLVDAGVELDEPDLRAEPIAAILRT